MNYTIRAFKDCEYDTIASWWVLQDEFPPLPGMMVEDGTFVLELNNIPVLSLTVFLTQSKEMAYIEAFIKNPSVKEFDLECYGQILWEHCYEYAKNKGYKRVVSYCYVDKLIDKYVRFGMRITVKNLTSLVKEF